MANYGMSQSLPVRRYEYNTLPSFTGNGYDSEFRFMAGNQMIPQHVFPGLQQSGNEAGFNAPLYALNANGTPILEINRRYTGKGLLKEYPR